MTHSPLYTRPDYPAPQKRPGYPIQPRPQSSQPLAWILTLALATFALVPQEQLSRLTGSLSPQQQSVHPWSINAEKAPTCQAVLHADQRLSRDQLTQFLSLAKASSQATVHETIAPPYCTLSRAQQPQQREAYPLAFDPDTWFVVNYDQGAYTDYDFVFRK